MFTFWTDFWIIILLIKWVRIFQISLYLIMRKSSFSLIKEESIGLNSCFLISGLGSSNILVILIWNFVYLIFFNSWIKITFLKNRWRKVIIILEFLHVFKQFFSRHKMFIELNFLIFNFKIGLTNRITEKFKKSLKSELVYLEIHGLIRMFIWKDQ